MQRPPAPSIARTRRPVWPIVVGASTIFGLLVGGVVSLDRHDVVLPKAPSGLTATATTCAPPRCPRIMSAVTLRWAATADRSLTGFRVRRDGSPIPAGDDLGAATTEFVDHGVTPGARHEYTVIATGPDGDAPASHGIDVQVPLPLLRAAQLRGVYEVTLVVRDAVNLMSLSGIPTPRPGERRRTTWGFQPLCDGDQGACPTGWTGRSGMLRPLGAGWSGKVFGPEARCPNGRRLPSPIELRLTPHDAAMLGGSWSVVSFSGAYSVRFHCAGFLVSHGMVQVTGRRR